MEQVELTPDEIRALRDQFIDAYDKSQEAFDTSVRMLAAAGVGVTVSLVAAFDGITLAGKVAITLFVISLSLNLGSFVTAQRDMRKRLKELPGRKLARIEGNRWTNATALLNISAGAALIAGAVLLAVFAASAA